MAPAPHRGQSAHGPRRRCLLPKRSETELRRLTAETFYELEKEARRQGYLEDPALIYDEGHDLFRFRDGQFAFSRAHGNWELLKKRGRMRGFGETW